MGSVEELKDGAPGRGAAFSCQVVWCLLAQQQALTVPHHSPALKETLERTGALRKLQGRVRSEVFHALSSTEEPHKPEPSNETLLINEVIREYLIFNGYRDTLSVFLPESGQPPVRPFDRAFLAQQLNMPQTAHGAQLPLLYSLVAAQQGKRRSTVATQDGINR